MPHDTCPAPSWRMSCHGGHTGLYCDHAEGQPEAFVEAAIAAGLSTYAFTEHAPRLHERYLYPTERAWGWTVGTLEAKFEAYTEHASRLVAEYADRITLLRGFEVEVVPHDRFAEIMNGFRDTYQLEWMVGSVHYVNDIIIDFTEEVFLEAAATCGGIEGLTVAYYQSVGRMAEALRPNVIGHLDLVRRNSPDEESIATPSARAAARDALDVIAGVGAAVEINTAGYRKGLGRPYPAPWLLEEVVQRKIPIVMSDDSHRAEDVGAGLDEAREYLGALGIREVACPVRRNGAVVRQQVALV